MKRNKAIIVLSAAMLAFGFWGASASKAYADANTSTQATDEQAKIAQLKATIDTLQKKIAELTAKVQAKQAAAPVKKMTLPEIAAEVQRIAKEKEILAQKVQAYVAAHPNTATAKAPASTVDTNKRIAEIKKEINALTEKLMAQKAGSQDTAQKEAVPAEVKAEPAEKTQQPEDIASKATDQAAQPVDNVINEPAAPKDVTPEITITPEGNVEANGEKQGITVTTENPKKGLFQSIADYLASLFKF